MLLQEKVKEAWKWYQIAINLEETSITAVIGMTAIPTNVLHIDASHNCFSYLPLKMFYDFLKLNNSPLSPTEKNHISLKVKFLFHN